MKVFLILVLFPHLLDWWLAANLILLLCLLVDDWVRLIILKDEPLEFLLPFFLCILILLVIKVNEDAHLVALLNLPALFLCCYFAECGLYHFENIDYSLLVLVELGQQLVDLLLQLLIVVEVWHPAPFQLVLDFLQSLFDRLELLRLWSVTIKLLLSVYRDEDTHCLSSEFIPGLAPWVLLHEYRNRVVLRESVLFVLLASLVLVQQIVFSFQLFGAATIIA